MLDDATILAALRGEQPLPADQLAGWLAMKAKPADRTLRGGVSAKVEILRDGAGVPHIYATSTSDVYFGLGFAMAEDRLWQMDRLRRRALGTQAEILGPNFLAADIAHHTVGLPEICAREVAAIDAGTRAIVDAFVAGINAGIAAFGADLPVEFRLLDYVPDAFTARDVLAIARGFWWSLNGRLDRLIAAEASRMLPEALRIAYLTPEASENIVLPGVSTVHPDQMAGTDDATGSNNWALAGHRTATGLPVLAGDPHQPFWIPASWYEFGLHGPEDDAAGSGHAGIPGLWFGSNGTSAWCLTNNMASTRDLYREEIDPADPTRYRDGAMYRIFETRTVKIAVRGAATQDVVIRSSVRGPIANALVPALNADGDAPMALRWVGMEHLDDIRAIIGLSRAKTWDAFRAGLRDWSVAVFNWVYADRHGHIGYQMAGRVPLRGRAWPGVRDGNNPDDVWQGYIPFEGLPCRTDPAVGHVASANQRIVPPDYPYPIYGAYSQGHRGVRLAELFGGGGRLDVAANIAVQNDVLNVRAIREVPHILGALDGCDDADVKAFAAALAGWDGGYTLDSMAPTLFETFMALWNRAVQAVHLPAHVLDLTVQQTGLCTAVLEGGFPDYFAGGRVAMVRALAKASIATLVQRLGADRAAWTWRAVHIAHWKHPLSSAATGSAFDVGPAPVDGGSHTLRNTGGELPPHNAGSGAEYRIVVDFSAPASFRAVQNTGNSGVPGSPFYRDQFAPWLAGQYHVVHLTRAGVEGDLSSATIIAPA